MPHVTKNGKLILSEDDSFNTFDYGTDASGAFHGPDGPLNISLPRNKPGDGAKTQHDKMSGLIAEALRHGNLVAEAATIGSFGINRDQIIKAEDDSGNHLFLVSGRLVKNQGLDAEAAKEEQEEEEQEEEGEEEQNEKKKKKKKVSHAEAAKILYEAVRENPGRAYYWRNSEPIPRVFRSVRPMDAHGYKDKRSDFFMSLLPPYELLSPDLRRMFGDGDDYTRSTVMPFAMALTEPYIVEGRRNPRDNFMALIGAWAGGYPSFYRRATVVLMQSTAKKATGKTRMADITTDERKEAWKATSKHLRNLFHIAWEPDLVTPEELFERGFTTKMKEEALASSPIQRVAELAMGVSV